MYSLKGKKKPLILITNDDGIMSKGIQLLIKWMHTLGEVIVIAPNKPQSGMSHAITMDHPIRLHKINMFDNIESYECSGTPVDCIKIATSYILKNRTIDLVVSGINHGRNTSISVLYSGTMAAAIEGAMTGIPAIGYSLSDFSSDADFSHIKNYVLDIAQQVLCKNIPKGIALNVNFPAKQQEKIKGIKICKQANTTWKACFEHRIDPCGRTYFWMQGDYVVQDKDATHDEWAVAHNYIAIVPCQFDLTAHTSLQKMEEIYQFS